MGFPGSSAGEESASSAGDLLSIPGLGGSPREGNASPLQYSGLANSMDCMVHEVKKSQTGLNDFHFPSIRVFSSESAFCLRWPKYWSFSFIISSHSLPKFMFTELGMPSSHLILCCHLLLLPSTFPSIRVFSSESVLCIKWPKYQSFSFDLSPSNEYLGLISFRMEWMDLLAVLGTLKSLLQHHSSKASILQHSAFYMIQLSHPYTTTGKTIALT